MHLIFFWVHPNLKYWPWKIESNPNIFSIPNFLEETKILVLCDDKAGRIHIPKQCVHVFNKSQGQIMSGHNSKLMNNSPKSTSLNDLQQLVSSKRFIKDITYQLYWQQHLFIFHEVGKRRECLGIILDLYKLFGPGQKKKDYYKAFFGTNFRLHQNSFGPVEGQGINYYKCCGDEYLRHVTKLHSNEIIH